MQFSRAFAILVALTFAGCVGQSPSSNPYFGAGPARDQNSTSLNLNRVHLNNHMLIFVTNKNELRYWPIDKNGGRTSYSIGTLKNVSGASAMAANGSTIAVAVQKPPSVVLFDTSTGNQSSLADSGGIPIDIAYDTHGDIFALNGTYRNVIVYKAPRFTATVVNCSLFAGVPEYVAVDRQGNIFVNVSVNSNSAIIEIPKGPNGYEQRKCSQLPIQESGYPAGLLVDSKTNSLIVFHNPDQCAGGEEGVMDTYAAPYGKGELTSTNLHGNCTATLRFGPDQQHVYFEDASPTLPRGHIRPTIGDIHVSQRSYPGGLGTAEYRFRWLTSYPTGITTIPNELPN
jgi:hypothetical protein